MVRVVPCQILLAAALLSGPPAAARPADSCVQGPCHAELATLRHAHRPVAAGVCRICHRPARRGEHRFALPREEGALCAVCHRELDALDHAHDDPEWGGCTVCHDPHGTGHRFLLRAAHVSDACEACHADLLAVRNVLHTPVATEPCTACHDPHGAAPRWPAPEGADPCLPCHAATRDELETSEHVHDPVRIGECGQCHDPHGSGTGGNLLAPVPGLCFACHEEIRETVETATNRHSVAGEPGGCLVCHAPHASAVGFGLRADPFTLCAGCHASEITMEDGTTISAVAHQVEASQFLHGPVRQRDCGACHDPHGSDHFRLLVENYSAEFYADFDLDNYKLCFSCHPQRGVLTERSTELTDFRNGSLNLHYLHVNKPEQGRTCRACHATHGADEPRQIREWVWFGQWKLPITFTKTATGGTCQSGCHVERAYDREDPVDYGIPGLEPEEGRQP